MTDEANAETGTAEIVAQNETAAVSMPEAPAAAAESTESSADNAADTDHALKHLEAEFHEWLSTEERKASEILEWIASKL